MDFNEYIDKLDNKQTLAMLIEIDNNYKNISLKIPAPKYDKNGKLKNAKEIKEALKELRPKLEEVWDNNLEIINKYSEMTLTNNYIVFELIKNKLNMTTGMISVEEWNKIQDKLLAQRQKKIKIQQVMKGNKNHLNKQVQKTVNEMYRDGYSWVDTQKALEKQFGYNAQRAKRIAITEKWYYKSEAQLHGAKGLDVYKVWIHSGKAKEPREHHKKASKKAVVRGIDAKFKIGDYYTVAPQHFGIPSEDINCRCTMYVELIEDVDLAPKEIQEAINNYVNDRNLKYENITEEWFKSIDKDKESNIVAQDFFEYEGKKYNVDGKYVVFETTKEEKEIANWLQKTFNEDVILLPRVNYPKEIKTPDYIFKNEYWDLKIKSGKDKQAIYHAIRDSNKQAYNFIIDFSKSPLSFTELLLQVKNVYSRTDINFDKLIIKKNDDFLIFKRK